MATMNFSEMANYDAVQIKQLLTSTPDKIWKAGRVRDTLDTELAELKQELKVELAKAHLTARAKSDLSSNDDRKAWATIQPQILELEAKIIRKDGELTAAKLDYDRYDNWFTAVRKAASMMVEIEKMVDYTNKYDGGK